MFSLNGVALDNPALGWEVISTSKPHAGIERRTGNLVVPGIPGVVPTRPSEAAPLLSLVLRTQTGAEALLALLDSATLELGDGSRAVDVELINAAPEHRTIKGKFWIYVTAVLRLNGVYWRDPDETTSSPASLASASVEVSVLAGLSAPVRDALVRVKGQETGLVVTDSGGTFFSYGVELLTATYLRFDSATGRAWVTVTDTWSGGIDVTGLINTGRWPFEIKPSFTDPSTRVGKLTVATATRSGATIEVRGRRAFRL